MNIESNTDSVVHGKTFSVTITGKPGSPYYLWVAGTHSMTGAAQGQAPIINFNQVSVFLDPDNGSYQYGSYAITHGGGKMIQDNIPPSGSGFPNTRYYAQIVTSTSGTRTVEFVTNNWTKSGTYDIRVQNGALSDDVYVNVAKGAVTMVAAGNQNYNPGDVIHLSGTNTASYKVYFFLDNYPPGGMLSAPPNVVTNNDPSTFAAADVLGDNTWSYNWNIAGLNLSYGDYMIYAVSRPWDKNHLGDVAYGM